MSKTALIAMAALLTIAINIVGYSAVKHFSQPAGQTVNTAAKQDKEPFRVD